MDRRSVILGGGIMLISSSKYLVQQFAGSINICILSLSESKDHLTSLKKPFQLRAIIIDADLDPKPTPADISWFRAAFPCCFIALIDTSAAEKPVTRYNSTLAGANMIAHEVNSLIRILEDVVIPAGTNGGSLSCPYCNMGGLTASELYYHASAYHISWPSSDFVTNSCPICNASINSSELQRHIHKKHDPSKSIGPYSAKPSSILYNFSLVICRHPVTNKFLLCQERSGEGFWCPGGKVDPGETLTDAARRETWEEAGVRVDLKGILSIQYNPTGCNTSRSTYFVRMRVIFYAEPTEESMQQFPKSMPDFESAGACWSSYEDMEKVYLRGDEPKIWAKYILDGNNIYPLSLLTERQG